MRRSESLAGMTNHLTYNIWNAQFQIVKKILTVHKEISEEDCSWEEKYELLEGELEIMFKEIEDFAVKRYNLHVDTSIDSLKDKKKLWSIMTLKKSDLEPIEK